MTAKTHSHAGLEAKARSGDLAAFGQLVREWDDDLRGVAWSVLRNAQDTDDVMQRSYEKAIHALPAFREHSSMKTWLHAICLRTAIDHTRYENRRRHLPDTELDRHVIVSSTSDAALDRHELAAALELLEPETRSLLMLTVGLGYSFDEAAQISGLPRAQAAGSTHSNPPTTIWVSIPTAMALSPFTHSSKHRRDEMQPLGFSLTR